VVNIPKLLLSLLEISADVALVQHVFATLHFTRDLSICSWISKSYCVYTIVLLGC